MKKALTHSGIKGMKWGIRRYQNKDGSLTPAGRKRYGSDSDGDSDGKKETSKSSTSGVKKSPKDMSNEELTSAIRRLELEQRYNQLNPQTVSSGKKYIQDLIDKAVMPAVTDAGRKLLNDMLVKVGKEKLGLDQDVKDPLGELRKEVETLRLKSEKSKLLKPDDSDADFENLKKSAERTKLEKEQMQNQDWINKRKKEQADAEAAAKKTTESTAEPDKTAQNTSKGPSVKDAKQTKKSTGPETVTGEVEGEGTSKFTGWKSDKNSKSYDVDVDFTKTTTSSPQVKESAAIGQNIVAGLLEQKTFMLEDKKK